MDVTPGCEKPPGVGSGAFGVGAANSPPNKEFMSGRGDFSGRKSRGSKTSSLSL